MPFVASAALALAGCGQSGPRVPEQFTGVWSADCTTPYVRFDGNKVHVYPDKADYALKASSFENNELSVTYDSVAGTLTDVYLLEGQTLRLTKTVTPGGQAATWTKRPMSKCG